MKLQPRNALIWSPGQGPDAEAIQRLKERFPCPRRPMGEAWFMSPIRKTYDFMLEGDEVDLDHSQLPEALWELASGPACFGPREEWTEWLHYLLGHVSGQATRAFNPEIQEQVMTAFMNRYPAGPEDDFDQGMVDDVLATLATVRMESGWWQRTFSSPASELGRADLSGGSLLLMAKYLSETDLPGWWRSVIAIDNVVWRANLLLWLNAASPLLLGHAFRREDIDEAFEWEASHLAFGNREENANFLPESRRNIIRSLIRETVTTDMLLEWIAAFEQSQPDSRQVADKLVDSMSGCFDAFKLRPN